MGVASFRIIVDFCRGIEGMTNFGLSVALAISVAYRKKSLVAAIDPILVVTETHFHIRLVSQEQFLLAVSDLVLYTVLILLLSGEAGLLHKFGSPASLHLH